LIIIYKPSTLIAKKIEKKVTRITNVEASGSYINNKTCFLYSNICMFNYDQPFKSNVSNQDRC